jgi:hypothetical protein
MFKHYALLLCVSVGVGIFLAPFAGADSIPPKQADNTKIYYGTPESFDEPAMVDFEQILKETPEYQEIKADNIKKDSGRFVVLLSQGSQRAHRAITKMGTDENYDLIAAKEYLRNLRPPVKAKDITKEVIEVMREAADQY